MPPPTGPVKLNGLEKDRTFVGVHNLHQSDRFHANFKRIPPTEEDLQNLKTQLGSTPENTWFDYKGTDKDGVQQVKLNVKLKEIKKDGPVTRSQAKRDFEAYKVGYNALHKELKSSLEEAHKTEAKGKSFFQKLFGKKSELKTKETLILKGDGDGSDRNIKVLTKSIIASEDKNRDITENTEDNNKDIIETTEDNNKGVTLKGVGELKDYNDKHKVKRAAYLGLAGFGIGVLIVGSFLTGGLLASVLGGMAVVGLGGMGLKAVFGKSPWWDKTAQGQREHMERKQARLVANDIRDEVKKFSLQAITTTEGKQKRDVLDDKAMLTDFVKLAAQNNSKELLAKVREAVIKPENQILSKDTLDNLNFKKGTSNNPFAGNFKFDWGNRVKHAKKTADIVAYEIARGIMAGVQEAVLQSEVGALSDKRTVEGEKIVLDIVGKDGIDAFQNAVNFLTPSDEANLPLESSTHIFETEQRLEELNRVRGTILPLIEKLKNAKGTIGAQNFEQYTERLQQLEGDLSVHMDSIIGVEKLIKGSGVPEDVHLDQILTGKSGYTDLFTEGFEKNPAEVEKTIKELKGKIQKLRSRISDENDMASSLLVKSQARMLVKLVDDVEEKINLIGKNSTAIASARELFKKGASLSEVVDFIDKRGALESKADVDYDPTKKIDVINSARGEYDGQLNDLIKLCENVKNAKERCNDYDNTAEKLREYASKGDLTNAFNKKVINELEGFIKEQKDLLDTWTAKEKARPDGYKIPDDLKQLPENLDEFKRELTALALGVTNPEDQKTLEKLLTKLGDSSHEETVKILQGLPQDTKIKTLKELEKLIANPKDPQKVSTSQDGLNSYIILKESLGNTEEAKKVNEALHAEHIDLINKFEHLSTAEKRLEQLFERSAVSKDNLSFGELLRSHLLEWESNPYFKNNDPADLIGQKNTGYSAHQFLHMISAFADKNSDPILVRTSDVTKRIAGILPDGASSKWISNAATFDKLDTNDLSELATLAEKLFSDRGFVQSVETRFEEDKNRVKAQATASIFAEKIAGVSSSEASQIQEKVQEGSALKNPEVKPEFDALLTEIDALLEQQKILEMDGTLSDFDINKNLKNLALALNWNAHKDEKINLELLRERLKTNHDVAQHFAGVLDLSATLQAAKGIGPVNHEFSPDDLLAGVKEIPKAILHISPMHGDLLPKSLKEALDQREKVKEVINNKDDNEIQGLLKKNKRGLTDYVKTFQQENRFVQEIKIRTANSSQSDASFRQQLEGAYDLQDNANKNLDSQQATNLSAANLAIIKQELLGTWTAQTKILENLIANSKSAPATGYYYAQLAQLKDNIQVLDQINENTLKDPETKSFAVLGKMLLDADHVKKLSEQQGDKVKHAYMKGQFELSRNAIKYLNPKTLNAARPGFIGRFIHRLFNRGERVNRLLRDSQKAQDIAAAILFITGKEVLNESQKAQLQEVNESLEKMFATRDSLVNDPKKVALAYQLLAAQHLANKPEGATLNQSDIDVIKSQWKVLLADDTKGAFKDIENQINHMVGKGLAEFDKTLTGPEVQKVAAEVDLWIQEHNEFLAGVDALKKSMDDLRFDRLNLSNNTQEAKLKSSIREVGLEYQDYETIQKLQDKNVPLQGILDQFQLANSETKNLLNETTTPVFRATQAKFELERTIADNKDKLTSDEIKNLESISRILEESFLERVGPSAPARLESLQDFAEIDTFTKEMLAYQQEIKSAQPDREKIDQFEIKMERFATKYKEIELLKNLEENNIRVPVHLIHSLAQARYQLFNIYKDFKLNSPKEFANYNLKMEAHAYTVGVAFQGLSNTKNDQSIPAKLGNDLNFQSVNSNVITDKFRTILTALSFKDSDTFESKEIKQLQNVAQAQQAHHEDFAIDQYEETFSQDSDEGEDNTQALTNKRHGKLLDELDREVTSEVQTGKSGGIFNGFFSLFGSNKSKGTQKIPPQTSKQVAKTTTKVESTSSKSTAKVPLNSTAQTAAIKRSTPSQQMAPSQIKSKPSAPSQQQEPSKIQNSSNMNANTFGVNDLRGRLEELNKKFEFSSKFSQNELEQLTSMLSSDKALLDYGEFLMPDNKFSRDVFAGLLDAQNEKEMAFKKVQTDLKPFFQSQKLKSPQATQSLEQVLKSLGIQKVDALGDGNCFFNAIADQVKSRQQDVRNALADRMQQLQKSTQRSPFLDESSVSAAAIQKTRTDARKAPGDSRDYWGQNYHAIVAAQEYNRPVVVISPLQVQVIRPDGSVGEGNAAMLQSLKTQNPIILCYNGSNHWDSGKFQ